MKTHRRVGVELHWFLNWAVDKLNFNASFCCFSCRTGAPGAQGVWRVPKLVGPISPDNFMGPRSPDNSVGPRIPDNFMGPRNSDILWAPEAVIILWGPEALIILKSALWALLPFWTQWCSPSIDVPPPTMRNRRINMCITSNFRYEAGFLSNLNYKRKSNLRNRKHARRNDFDLNSLINTDLSPISNYIKKVKVRQFLYTPEQVLRALEG